MNRSVRTVWAFAVTAGLLVGCSAPVKRYECDTQQLRTRADATEIWVCHRKIVQRVVSGAPFTIEEFTRAAAFFARLTGIEADAVPTYVGLVPGKGLQRTGRAWDRWYEENAERLYWDSETGRVEVFEPSPADSVGSGPPSAVEGEAGRPGPERATGARTGG